MSRLIYACSQLSARHAGCERGHARLAVRCNAVLRPSLPCMLPQNTQSKGLTHQQHTHTSIELITGSDEKTITSIACRPSGPSLNSGRWLTQDAPPCRTPFVALAAVH